MTTSLTWDAESRLKTVSVGGNTDTYTYNGLGQRVKKVEGGVTFNYTLRDDSIDTAVLGDGAASYTHGLGLVSENRGGTSKYLHADALGTTRAWSDSSGVKTDSLDTDAFGMVVASSGSTPKPFGFAGQHGYQSDATGLMRLGHRYYDASTGRFISRDPIRDGYNWYNYCDSDPINCVDPKGTIWIPLAATALTLWGLKELGDWFDKTLEEARKVPPLEDWDGVNDDYLNDRNRQRDKIIRDVGNKAAEEFVDRYVMAPIGKGVEKVAKKPFPKLNNVPDLFGGGAEIAKRMAQAYDEWKKKQAGKK
ncbi:MAG: hypothetical protein OHK0029_36670 [Armatimonadaceae bacterium]